MWKGEKLALKAACPDHKAWTPGMEALGRDPPKGMAGFLALCMITSQGIGTMRSRPVVHIMVNSMAGPEPWGPGLMAWVHGHRGFDVASS